MTNGENAETDCKQETMEKGIKLDMRESSSLNIHDLSGESEEKRGPRQNIMVGLSQPMAN